MAKICRLLIFTLLLHIFWLPSGALGANASEATPAENLISTLLKAYISSGCKGGQDAAVATSSERGDVLSSDDCSTGERSIIADVVNYFAYKCLWFFPDEFAAADPKVSTGQRHIIKLLPPFFNSGCKAAVDAVGITQSAGYSVGEVEIIKLLSSDLPSTCKGTRTEPPPVVPSGEPGGGGAIIHKSKGNSTGPTNSRSGPAGHRVQSVLEWFLLICGVYFTRVELLA